MLASAITILLLGCSSGDGQQSQAAGASDLGNLPYITHHGVSYPYLRYAETTNQASSRGKAVFLHPIKASKSEILVLEYAPGMKVADLFAEELLGTGGRALYSDGQLGFSFLPISLPVGVVQGQKWRMKYATQDFVCSANGKQNYPSNPLVVSCNSNKYRLYFKYDKQIGVTEYQDFCDLSICTYKLMDSQGLLSGPMVRLMGLPKI